MIEPPPAAIFIMDDQPLNRITSSASLSACLSLIQQECVYFDDTLHANISMYKDSDKDELEKSDCKSAA